MIHQIIIKAKTITELRDMALLEKLGFNFEKEIKEYLHELAKKTREAIYENN